MITTKEKIEEQILSQQIKSENIRTSFSVLFVLLILTGIITIAFIVAGKYFNSSSSPDDISVTSEKSDLSTINLVGVIDKTEIEKSILDQINSSYQKGVISIEAGQKRIEVFFESTMNSEPIVSVTPVDFFGNYTLTNIQNNSFTILIEESVDTAVKFYWRVE